MLPCYHVAVCTGRRYYITVLSCRRVYRQAVLYYRVIVSPCVQAGGNMLPCYRVAVCTGRRYYITVLSCLRVYRQAVICYRVIVSPCVQAGGNMLLCYRVAVCTGSSSKNYKTPVVCMVVEGGVNTVHTVLDYVTDEPPVPVVVMSDSGRAANLLSLAHKIIGSDRLVVMSLTAD
jgi:hypothetical protein